MKSRSKIYTLLFIFTIVCIVSVQASSEISPIILKVLFKTQYPPGTGWDKTKNCGQATFLMAWCYHNKTKPTSDAIKLIDDWMDEHLNLEKNYYNGSPTNIYHLYILAVKYGKMKNSDYYYFYTLNSIRKELIKNNPVIVSVFYPSPGNPDIYINHSLLVVGLTNDHVIVNDPGRTNGKQYSIKKKDFMLYWTVHLREALVVRQ